MSVDDQVAQRVRLQLVCLGADVCTCTQVSDGALEPHFNPEHGFYTHKAPCMCTTQPCPVQCECSPVSVSPACPCVLQVGSAVAALVLTPFEMHPGTEIVVSEAYMR